MAAIRRYKYRFISRNTIRGSFSPLLALLSVLFSVLFHGYNVSSVAGRSMDGLRHGVTITTADDASYLAPVENFLDGKGWRSNTTGNAAYTTRTPGYGFLYFIFRTIFKPPVALFALVCFQILLFAIAVGFIPILCKYIGLSGIWPYIPGLTVAVLPMFSGFLSYTLTEGVTPALVIFFFVLLLKGYRGSSRFLLYASFLLGFAILVRPPLLVLSFGFLPLVFSRFSSVMAGRVLLLFCISAAPLFLWNVHLKSITGKWAGLHPIYHADSDGLYRPIHQKIWNFHKMTGQTGVEFHRSIGTLNQSALGEKPLDAAVENVLDRLPARVFEAINRDSLAIAYISYRNILGDQYQYVNDGGEIHAETRAELKLGKLFNHFRKQYIETYPIHSMIAVPLKVYGNLTFHSNLSLFIFQKPWRGNPFMEILRLICFAIHSLSFLIFPIATVYFLRKPFINALTFPILIYLTYLVFVQRGIEERYTLPFLIPVFLLSVLFLTRAFSRVRTLIKLRYP